MLRRWQGEFVSYLAFHGNYCLSNVISAKFNQMQRPVAGIALRETLENPDRLHDNGLVIGGQVLIDGR